MTRMMMYVTMPVVAAVMSAPVGALPAEKPLAGKEARKVMRDFAECVVKRQHDIARDFVLRPVDERLEDKDYRALINGACLSMMTARLQMRSSMFRGALAERLIAVDLGDAPIDPANKPALTWATPMVPASTDAQGKPLDETQLAALQVSYDQTVADRFVSQLGECIVRADPAGVRVALATKQDAESEKTALIALGGVIAGCVAKGQTLKFNRSTLRAGLATSYYRISQAAPIATEADS